MWSADFSGEQQDDFLPQRLERIRIDRMIRLLVTLLLCSMLVLTYLRLDHSDSTDSVPLQNPLAISEYKTDLVALNPMARYVSIAQRPLFEPTRRPPVKKVEKKAVKTKPRIKQLQLQALGIAVTDKNVLAVVKDLRTGKTRRMRINDEFDGWVLKSVSDNNFIFQRQGVEKIVKFKEL